MITPYLYESSWYDIKRKKPTLQLKILNELVLEGRLSKSKARLLLKEHNYHEVSNAFNNLNDKRLIEISNIQPGRGKPEINYRITQDGIASLIIENPTPKNFWSLVIAFCGHSNNQVSLEIVDDFYQFFIKRYLKYPSGKWSVLQLDSLNKMCKIWIQKNIKDNDGINLAQKVIEVLALYPRSTAEELTTLTNETKQNVAKVLSEYTMIPSMYSNVYAIDMGDLATVIPERYLDFIQHSIIIVKPNAKDVRCYKLSLFGLILVMTLVRKYRTFYSFSLQEYYDKIISNYKDDKLLPLIFGKWNMLKEKLKALAANNFDIILDEEARSAALRFSVVMDGHKEFYENMRSIVIYVNKQVNEVLLAGESKLTEYELDYLTDKKQRSLKKKDNSKTISVERKLQEIYTLLRYAETIYFQNEIYEEEQGKIYANTDTISAVEILSDALAEEITFLYYLILQKDYYVPLIFPCPDLTSTYSELLSIMRKIKMKEGSSLPKYVDFLSLISPIQKFREILEKDEEIKKWFYGWKRDLIDFQKEVAEVMSR